MPRHMVGYALVGVFLLSTGGGIYTLYTDLSSSEGPQVREGYCKECGRQLPRNGECPFCRVQKAAAAQKEQLHPSPWKKASLPLKLTVFISTSLLCVFFAYRSWTPKQKDEVEEEQFRFRCPKCERKIRYTTKKIGAPALCPGCREAFVFPEPERVD